MIRDSVLNPFFRVFKFFPVIFDAVKFARLRGKQRQVSSQADSFPVKQLCPGLAFMSLPGFFDNASVYWNDQAGGMIYQSGQSTRKMGRDHIGHGMIRDIKTFPGSLTAKGSQ